MEGAKFHLLTAALHSLIPHLTTTFTLTTKMQLPTLALLTAVSLSKLAAAQFELGWQGNGLYAFCNAATDTCLGTIEDPITDGAPIVGMCVPPASDSPGKVF